jgi:hypothetical protein
MQILSFSLKQLVLATVAGVGFVSAAIPTLAQTPGLTTLQDPYQQQNDPFGQGTGDFNMFQLIHNANLGGSYNPEFFTEQRQQITDEASAFRIKQQQLLQQAQRVPQQCQQVVQRQQVVEGQQVVQRQQVTQQCQQPTSNEVIRLRPIAPTSK